MARCIYRHTNGSSSRLAGKYMLPVTSLNARLASPSWSRIQSGWWPKLICPVMSWHGWQLRADSMFGRFGPTQAPQRSMHLPDHLEPFTQIYKHNKVSFCYQSATKHGVITWSHRDMYMCSPISDNWFYLELNLSERLQEHFLKLSQIRYLYMIGQTSAKFCTSKIESSNAISEAIIT